MAEEVILRPNETVSNAWSIGDHTDINEDVTQPDISGVGFLTATESAGDNNDIVVLGFPDTITDVDEVTNITVWSWIGIVGNNSAEIDINMGGWLEDYREVSPIGWTSDSFNGSWTQEDLDGLQVRLRADVPVKYNSNIFDVLYVVVTYIPISVGYTAGKPMGIATNKIGKVLGILTANIGKIKGI